MRLTSLREIIPDVTYTIRVGAINSAGAGPLSQVVMVKTVQGGKLAAFMQCSMSFYSCGCRPPEKTRLQSVRVFL